jgi:hypothetical protein
MGRHVGPTFVWLGPSMCPVDSAGLYVGGEYVYKTSTLKSVYPTDLVVVEFSVKKCYLLASRKNPSTCSSALEVKQCCSLTHRVTAFTRLRHRNPRS